MLYEDNALIRFLWPLLAALAGGITALSLRPFKGMSPLEVVLAVFVSMSFAVFVGPIAVHWMSELLFAGQPVDARILGALYYLMAAGAHGLIPLAIRKMNVIFGQGSKS